MPSNSPVLLRTRKKAFQKIPVYGITGIMKNTLPEKRQPKSTILLLLFIGILFYAGLMFRAGLNTLFFVKDTSMDYAPVHATVKDLQAEPTINREKTQRIIPVFSLHYKGEDITLEAPRLAFDQGIKEPPFKRGEQYSLWVHKTRGELIVPPRAGQKEIGRSQMVISFTLLMLAVAIWILRNQIAAKRAE
jgi:hypothetical protein